MRFRVMVNLNKPLRREVMIKTKLGHSYWVYFKYEKLFIFCYIFGCCGHSFKDYERNLENEDDQDHGVVCGELMKALPMKKAFTDLA